MGSFSVARHTNYQVYRVSYRDGHTTVHLHNLQNSGLDGTLKTKLAGNHFAPGSTLRSGTPTYQIVRM